MKDNFKRKFNEINEGPLPDTVEKKYKSNTIINGMIYFNREIKDIELVKNII